MADDADRMFRTCETSGATLTMGGSFIQAGIMYIKSGDTYILGWNEDRVRGSASFKEVRDVDVLIGSVSLRRMSARWGIINSGHFSS
jgi:hypothetical protein